MAWVQLETRRYSGTRKLETDIMVLLRNQHDHRSSYVTDTVVDCHHHFKIENPDTRIVPYLEQDGFSCAAFLGSCKIDKTLVIAMVERWRSETHTFHLPIGECTITLEDVALQLGFPIHGRPVTGPSGVNKEEECMELLGVIPPQNQISGQSVKLKWLKDAFENLPYDAFEEQILRHCRAYMLRLIGGLLIPDKSCNIVHLMYLPLLRDFHRVGQYNWGSACLANLYRQMCLATTSTYACVGGCTMLLQSWVQYRMSFLAPECDRPTTFPLAHR